MIMFFEFILKLIKRRKLLFNNPCYFHTYFLQNELRNLGYQVDTYVTWDYPKSFIWYHSYEMIRPPFIPDNRLKSYVNAIHQLYLYATSEYIISLGGVMGGWWGFVVTKIFRSKQLCVISSCATEARMSSWMMVGNGRLCNNCGLLKNNTNHCTETHADQRLKSRLLFSHGEITSGAVSFSETPNERAIPFISCDKSFFNRELVIPHHLKINKKEGFVYIIHSFAADKNRLQSDGLNPIKGTKFILDAIDRLINEGYKIELINPTNIIQKDMRFLQLQADFCVEELFYGWWGSTPLECAALGIPSLLFIDPDFEAHWYTNFPDLKGYIPFLNTTHHNVYSNIKLLCDNPVIRDDLSRKSLIFADKFLDTKKNARSLLSILN